MNNKEMIIQLLGTGLRGVFTNIQSDNFNELQEIRLRAYRPLIVHANNQSFYLTNQGYFTKSSQKVVTITSKDILETLEIISDYSLYAYEEELKNGYITVKGGHRVGVVGKAVTENRKVRTLRNISGLNIRIAHEIKGCANKVLPFIIDKRSNIHNTLIVSPPKCGKTTLLRDMIRQLSNGYRGMKVDLNIGVVDERSEIAGCYKGVPQKDVGLRTDVLDACPKAEGMIMLLRSMSPDIIAVDEIGSQDDLYAIEQILNAGVRLICTVHGYSLEDIKRKDILNKLLDEGVFGRLILLNNSEGIGTIEGIFNEKEKDIYKKVGCYHVG